MFMASFGAETGAVHMTFSTCARVPAALIAAGLAFTAFSAQAEPPAPNDIEPPAAAMDEGAQAAPQSSAEDEDAAAREFVASLTPRHGKIEIAQAKATFDVPDEFYFLDQKDARRVLEEAWRNPPDESTLGMIFARDSNPLDDGVWGAVITYAEDGYVSDKDATKIDYDKVLGDIKKDAAESNKWRKENGYVPVDVVGWATPPRYDAATHKILWAKEVKFGEAEENTLNYDLRVLGRRGVLVVQFVAPMSALPEIEKAAPDVLSFASFDPGSRYADFVPGTDKVAAYGLVGLIAGAAIAKKTGLIAALLVFGKKIIALAAVGLAAIGAWLRKMFGKKPGSAD